MRNIKRSLVVTGLLLAGFGICLADNTQLPDSPSRHLIYLHGRIVQVEQSSRPKHREYGYYELEEILDTFRGEGFIVSGAIRPKSATVSESADRVVEQVRRLLKSGVPAEHITVLGASMGAGVALVASARLQNPDVLFSVLGTCLSRTVQRLIANGEKGPIGKILAIREASDEVTGSCPPWKDAPESSPQLEAREIVIETGLHHGFLYTPNLAWVNPVLEWARRTGER